MKIKLIGCVSTMNEVQRLGKNKNIDYVFLDFSYHANPVKLHYKLQNIIDKSQDYDLIILTYGRCSNATTGLVSARVPLLFPKVHDCIGLLLGSNERYLKLLRESPDTYFFSPGWLDYGRDPYSEYLEYERKYGKENAEYLIKNLYNCYKRTVLITIPGINMDYYRQQVRNNANFFGWQIIEVEGNLNLLSSILKGVRGIDMVYVEAGRQVTTDLLQEE